MIGNLSYVEIVKRIEELLYNLPMGIYSEVSIVHSGTEAPYILTRIEAYDLADQAANTNNVGIDSTFWHEDFVIKYDTPNDVVVEILSEIEAKTDAYVDYFTKEMEESHKSYEKINGEYAEWIALDRVKMEIVESRTDFLNHFQADFVKNENIVILKNQKSELPF